MDPNSGCVPCGIAATELIPLLLSQYHTVKDANGNETLELIDDKLLLTGIRRKLGDLWKKLKNKPKKKRAAPPTKQQVACSNFALLAYHVCTSCVAAGKCSGNCVHFRNLTEAMCNGKKPTMSPDTKAFGSCILDRCSDYFDDVIPPWFNNPFNNPGMPELPKMKVIDPSKW